MKNEDMGPIELQEILAILPHRYPFQLLDRVVSWRTEPEITLTAIKNVTSNEPFFPGHFPGNPVMPGVLIIEAMAQASGVLAFVSRKAEKASVGLYYLAKIEQARFNTTVKPGDQLVLEVRQKRMIRGTGFYDCRALVEDEQVASAQIVCAGRPNP
jgi:3-hydroxyacyl-[acyl-carrier-protein] dehydratase